MRCYSLFILLLLSLSVLPARGQRLQTRTGRIGFFSVTPLENIEGVNSQSIAVLDFGKKEIAVAALLKGFLFPRALMQEHFNENYVESDRYPKTTFSGTWVGEVNLLADGRYPVRVSGQIALHGVTRKIEVPALIEVKGGQATATARFPIRPEDFQIRIPHLVRDKIAKEIDVQISLPFRLTKE